jgi:hypothetical protein
VYSSNSFDYDCAWRSAFNLRGDAKGCFGYLTVCSGLGGLRLSKDIEVPNPFDGPGQQTAHRGPQISCIGMIESLRYAGGANDPIRVVSYVSKASASNLRARLAQPLTNLRIKIAWYVIDFDADSRTWFDAAFIKDAAGADACLSSAQGNLQIAIDLRPEPIDAAFDVSVYRFELEVLPLRDSSTHLEFAAGPTLKMVREWKG